MSSLNFKVNLKIEGANRIPEIEARMQNLQPAFENIIELWLQENVEKFSLGAGQATTGASQSGGVEWESLTPGYMKSKSKKESSHPTDIMQRTGALAAALTNDGGIAIFLNPLVAVFGQPLDPDLAARAGYNWDKRQVIFLDQTDKLNIQREIYNYLTLGENYQNILFATGAGNVSMDSEFSLVTE